MTIREFILECENYEHSKEHYQLLKEASELDLLNQFISDQEYMLEHRESLFAADSPFTESYFTEKIDKEKIDDLKEKAVEKAGNIKKTIIGIFKKIITALKGFFGRFMDKMKDHNERQKAIVAYIKANKISEQQWNTIVEIVKEVEENKDHIWDFECGANDRYKLKFEDKVPSNYENYKKYLLITLEPSHIYADYRHRTAEHSNIIDMDEAIKIADGIIQKESISPKEISKLKNKVDTAIRNCKTHGLKLFLRKKSIEAMYAQADFIEKNLGKMNLDNMSNDSAKNYIFLTRVLNESVAYNIKCYQELEKIKNIAMHAAGKAFKIN